MALTATMYVVDVDLSDVDRGVYERLALRVARHPSETAGYMLSRILAYCLEYAPGIRFSDGVSAGDEPAVSIHDQTGQITTWIEVGMPDADRLHRAAKVAQRVAVYTHRNVAQLQRQLAGSRIHRAAEIPILSFAAGWVDAVAEALDRRSKVQLSVTGRELYLELAGKSWHSPIFQEQVGSVS